MSEIPAAANDRRYQELLQAIVESSDDAIVGKSLDGIISSWNRGAEQVFGYTAAEMIGQSIMRLIPPERQHEEKEIVERIRNRQRVDHFETVRRRKDGTYIDVSLTVSPIKDATGRVIGASKIARDITQRKSAELEVKRARDQALAAGRAKDEFLAALSHELRTPLNPVLLLASENARDLRLSAEVRADFATICKNVELEARLIGDLLDITRIGHNKLTLELGALSLHATLEDALGTVKEEMEKKAIRLTRDFSASADAVWGDGVRLQQIFWNILINAVKFTPPSGTIVVSTRTFAENTRIAVSIADSGIGLTADELARVFDAFAQGEHADAGRSGKYGGLGLGLAISRSLAELHLGRIHATSAGRSQGAVFTVELPLQLSAPRERFSAGGKSAGSPPAVAASENGTRGGRILLVDDHAATRLTLANLLGRHGCEVTTAGSAAEARDLAIRKHFDAIISDIGLPDGDGCSLMTALRAVQPSLKGIALSGYGMDEDIARSRAAGFAAHLIKPVNFGKLQQALTKALGEAPL